MAEKNRTKLYHTALNWNTFKYFGTSARTKLEHGIIIFFTIRTNLEELGYSKNWPYICSQT